MQKVNIWEWNHHKVCRDLEWKNLAKNLGCGKMSDMVTGWARGGRGREGKGGELGENMSARLWTLPRKMETSGS